MANEDGQKEVKYKYRMSEISKAFTLHAKTRSLKFLD